MRVVAIIDYGLGNILSAQKSFQKVINDMNFNAKAIITNKPKDIANSSHIVLPGQGAFKTCMTNLTNIPGMIEELENKVLIKGVNFLGICIGMQLLADISYENGEHKGLGWIRGMIKKIPSKNLKLPHMSWNEVKITKKNSLLSSKEKMDFYFVHSYYFDCLNDENVFGTTNYGINFTSFVAKENIYGVQFHPEKSSSQGLELIKNFILK
tara:strand:- start:157 stop:786 length:630 start_codon:yes stop_codon:yes gene_type:complete